MKRKKTVFIFISILAGFVLIWLFFIRKSEKTVVVETEKPTTGYISESITATGTIQPVDTVSVGTQVSGTIASLYADFNSNVKKGQLLAELDKTLLQTTVDQFKASLAQAKSNLTYQEANFNRQKQLFATGSISKADYDLALNSYHSAKASVSSVIAQLTAAQRNLSFTEIYSPIDGVVLNRNVSIGQTVAASFSTPTLFVIAKDIKRMQVQANVDEADIGAIKEGLRATFTVDAFLEDVFKGNIREIRLQPSTSSNVVTYRTLINASNDDQKLKPGMTANITIYTKEVENALLISAEALKFKPDSTAAKDFELVPFAKQPDAGPAKVAPLLNHHEAYVWIVKDKRLLQKKIKTGINNNTLVEVLEGLTEDDVVATKVDQSAVVSTGVSSSPFMPKPPQRKN